MTTIIKDDHNKVMRAIVKIDRDLFFKRTSHSTYENEKYWLNALKDTGIVPRILMFDDSRKMLALEYKGEPVTSSTLPEDWKEQMNRILRILKDNNCRHNDIKPAEILVHNRKIFLCDFGWASRMDRPVPRTFPNCLGGPWKCPTGFNDRFSFEKSINSILVNHFM